jgi:guanylate kinase
LSDAGQNQHNLIARRGLLLVLSSPSGAGKTTLARRLLAADPTLRVSVSSSFEAATCFGTSSTSCVT